MSWRDVVTLMRQPLFGPRRSHPRMRARITPTEEIIATSRDEPEDPYAWLELHQPQMWGFRQMVALMHDFDKRLTALEKDE